jgi:hypothetical protein
MLAIAKRLQRLQVACADVCARTVETPTRAEYDDAVYLSRVEQYNAWVRCLQTLFAMLPDEARAKFPVPVPATVPWEEALVTRDRIRDEISEAVATRKASRGSVGPELAELLKAALKRGRSREDVAELLQTAADSVRAPREEAPSPPAP